MKTFFLLCSIFTLSSIGFSQNFQLPQILVPSEQAKAEAARLNAQAVKILPRGMFAEQTENSDIDCPLGIRGDGAYYSFTTGSHSYNKTPEIQLEQGQISVGFAGADYGTIADMGLIDIKNLTDTQEFQFLSTYKPPQLEPEVRMEQRRFAQVSIAGIVYRERVPASLRHTYLLRAISFDKSDILVALTIIEVGEDGSATFAWRKLADFAKPTLLYMRDADLKAAIEKIIKEKDIFHSVTVGVKDNVVYVKGSPSLEELNIFYEAMQSVRDRGIRVLR